MSTWDDDDEDEKMSWSTADMVSVDGAGGVVGGGGGGGGGGGAEVHVLDGSSGPAPLLAACRPRPRTISSHATSFLMTLSRMHLEWHITAEANLMFTLRSVGGISVKADKTLLILDTQAVFKVKDTHRERGKITRTPCNNKHRSSRARGGAVCDVLVTPSGHGLFVFCDVVDIVCSFVLSCVVIVDCCCLLCRVRRAVIP